MKQTDFFKMIKKSKGKQLKDEKPKKHKYNCSPKEKRTFDNITFDSVKEMQRYKELKWQKENGLIKDFELQPRFDLIIKTKYYADFKVIGLDNEIHYEDVKGFETAEFKKKMRHMKKQLPEEYKKLRILK